MRLVQNPVFSVGLALFHHLPGNLHAGIDHGLGDFDVVALQKILGSLSHCRDQPQGCYHSTIPSR